MIQNENTFFGATLYVQSGGNQRIIKVVPFDQRKFKVSFDGFRTFVAFKEFPNTLLTDCNFFTYSPRGSLVNVSQPMTEDEEEDITMAKMNIHYLERFENLKQNYKHHYIRSVVDEDIYDVMIIRDIDVLKSTGKISPLLQKMFDNQDRFVDILVYADHLSSRYDDLNYQMAYLYGTEKTFRQLLKTNNHAAALNLINTEFEKFGMK